MRTCLSALLLASLLNFALGAAAAADPPRKAEIIRLQESTWDAVPEGKEVDAIYGDWVLRNGSIVAVIGDAIEGRNANMTVRNVGGSVIDLTLREAQSDQLSAYYPVGTGYKLTGPIVAEGQSPKVEGQFDVARLVFRGEAIEGKSTAEVIYELAGELPVLKVTTRITNTDGKSVVLDRLDAMRADGEFEFGGDEATGLFWAYDRFWQQAYGVQFEDRALRLVPGDAAGRGSVALTLEADDAKRLEIARDMTIEFVRYIYPAANTLDVRYIAQELRGPGVTSEIVALTVTDPQGPVSTADVTFKQGDEDYGHGQTDAQGKLTASIPNESFQIVVSGQGRGERTVEYKPDAPSAIAVELASAGYVALDLTDEKGKPIPCKIQFFGRDGTPDPNFGPDSAVLGVRNVCYEPGFGGTVPILPGAYDVIVSHGPEYDAIFTKLDVKAGGHTPLTGKLIRTVTTPGWLSADFHSHSTPSGDNTSNQRGRVLNLLAEHIEFAPCTEHNRITRYDPHIEFFEARERILTCPGMELTGRPLPINHQNAFPLTPRPRTQDGGGPRPDADPVVQIERLAMWDNGSEKLVQINHPNIPQMVGDRDTDGTPDGGFERMFSFMDVIEVHPLDNIFKTPESLPNQREGGNAIFHWMQLLNLGYRMPGVVNTDAHWNFHGSGSLRNYVKSATDEPAKGSVAELVRDCERGHIVMTTGPYLEATATAAEGEATANVGDDLKAPGGKLTLKVRVQCPNWLSVNRVQVFVNGRPAPEANFTARTQPAMFSAGPVVFDQIIPLTLATDAHIIVACIGEEKGLGAVMGPDHGKTPPCAVGNPFFVDIDGDGFKSNGDMLGLPLVIAPDQKKSK